MLSPKKVILGGGVMQQAQLFEMIRDEVRRNLNGYVSSEVLLNHLDSYIVPPGLGNRAGLVGALALGAEALRQG
ncbi:putative fructokinase [compost metagenome]